MCCGLENTYSTCSTVQPLSGQVCCRWCKYKIQMAHFLSHFVLLNWLELIKPPLTFWLTNAKHLSAAVLISQRTDRIRWMNRQNLMGGWTCISMHGAVITFHALTVALLFSFVHLCGFCRESDIQGCGDVFYCSKIKLRCSALCPPQPRATDALPCGP